MEPVSPNLTSALDSITRSVDAFTVESRNLRESVFAGTIQRVRYARYTAIFAALATLLVIATIILSSVQIKTILDAKSSRNAQFAQTTANQDRIEVLIREQQTAGQQLRTEAVRSAVVSSYCASSYEQVAQIQACLTRNGVEVPSDFKLVK